MATATKAPRAASANGNGKSNQKSATAADKPAQNSGPTADQFRACADTLKMIADGTRLQIAYLLYHGEQNVGWICVALGMSQPSVSHHIALQRHSGIIKCRRDGKTNVYSLTEKGRNIVAPIVAMLDA